MRWKRFHYAGSRKCYRNTAIYRIFPQTEKMQKRKLRESFPAGGRMRSAG